MRRVTDIIRANNWNQEDVCGTVTLSYQERHRRKIKMHDDRGQALLLDLAEAIQMEEGDALVLEEGGIIAVKAAKEDVLDIQCITKSETARIAWHIGNRHTAIQVLENGVLRIIYDHVLESMLKGLSAKTIRNEAIFSPERGAYNTSESVNIHTHDH
jgi:urease accessory protein